MLLQRYVLASLVAARGWTSSVWFPSEDLTIYGAGYGQTSAVSSNGNWLYIDGGHVVKAGSTEQSLFATANNSTLVVDLTSSWTNSTIISYTTYVDKGPSFPFGSDGTLWYSEANQAIFMWASTPDNPVYAGVYVWRLDTDVTGQVQGNWTPSASQPPPAIPLAYGGVNVQTDATSYRLGGLHSTGFQETSFALPGLVQFNESAATWSNLTAPFYTSRGQGVSAPRFGDAGVLIFMGGFESADQYGTTSESLPSFKSMTEIRVFDITTSKWYSQTASGSEDSIPNGRQQFCAVGVTDEQSNLDIFIYGGQENSTSFDGNSTSKVFVLSLPEFRWNVVPNSGGTPRASLTCSVIGRSQMVVIGGYNQTSLKFTGSDPWHEGIGVFDLSALAWSSEYNANASAYTRATTLSAKLSGHATPAWDDPALAKIFVVLPPMNSTMQSTKHSNAAAIGGGVGGGVGGLLILAAIGCYFYTRRRRQVAQQRSQLESQLQTHFDPKLDVPSMAELSPDDVSRPEVPTPVVKPNVELQGDVPKTELPGDAPQNELADTAMFELDAQEQEVATNGYPRDVKSPSAFL